MLLLFSIANATSSSISPASVLDAGREAGVRAYARLERLCDDVGARPAGSQAYARAVELTRSWLAEDGATPRVEPVPVHVWARGVESLTLLAPTVRPLAVLGLGGTVGTPGIEAPVVVVRSFDELGPQVAGKIVLYDTPMGDGAPAVARYGTAVQYRWAGASKAAAFGAVASLVRSVTTRSLYTVHTGAMGYDDASPHIPTAAITPEDAAQIDRLVARGVEVRVRLQLDDGPAADAVDANVIGELRGREKPDEVVLLGAHLDSWDVGQGAQDDGAGVVEVVEALRVLRSFGVPRRTVRVVLFANEEHGGDGGRTYFANHGKEHHVAALESDLGAGAPVRFQPAGNDAQVAWLRGLAAPVGLPVDGEGGGADIGPLAQTGTLLVGFMPDDSHYFDIHHTRADTLDKVDPADLGASIGAIAALAWQLADAPGDAPKGTPKPAAP